MVDWRWRFIGGAKEARGGGAEGAWWRAAARGGRGRRVWWRLLAAGLDLGLVGPGGPRLQRWRGRRAVVALQPPWGGL
jgi:hypothetical protein